MAVEIETKPSEQENSGIMATFVNEILYSPVNLILLAVIVFLVYKIVKTKFARVTVETPTPALPKMRKDMTLSELKQYDGNQADGRILLAVNGWIFDVTRGKRFYGPGQYLLCVIHM